MLRLLIGNIEPGTSDEELGEFLTKYGFPAWDDIAHVPGDGSRPAVMLSFGDISSKSLEKLSERIHHMFWKGRQLNAMIIGQYMP